MGPPSTQETRYQIIKKHVTKYKYMRKWMVEFLRKSQSRVIKIARVNSIRMTKSVNLL